MGSRQKLSMHTWELGQSPLIRHIVVGWQNPNWQRSPAMQSVSSMHAGGGTLKQSPAKQLWVGGQSLSRMQPPATVHWLLMHIRMSGQSMSEPQKSQGRQRSAMQVQLTLQSALLAQVVGWQYSPSQRSPASQSASTVQSGAMKQRPKSPQKVPGGHPELGPGGLQKRSW